MNYINMQLPLESVVENPPAKQSKPPQESTDALVAAQRERWRVAGNKRYAEKRQHILAVRKIYKSNHREKILAQQNARYRKRRAKLGLTVKDLPHYTPEMRAAAIRNAQIRWRERNIDKIRTRNRVKAAATKSTLSVVDLKEIAKSKAVYDRQYRSKNRARRKAYMQDPERKKRWRQLANARYKMFRARPVRKRTAEESLAADRASWRKYGRKKRQEAGWRMVSSVRSMVGRLLKCEIKSGRSMELLGCTRAELIAHIERQFQPGMSWENYGLYGWHADHRKPVSSFDLSNPDQQKACFSYKNLQPLWAIDNLKKGASFPLTSVPISPQMI